VSADLARRYSEEESQLAAETTWIVSMHLNLRPLLRNNLLHNVVTLYAVQACTYFLPLLTLPYLARILGPSGWGAVSFAQAIGGTIAVVVEYGFDFSATRETARQKNNRYQLAELVSGVLGAKIVLSVICLCAAMTVRKYTLHIAPSPPLFWASIIWGVAQGINMLWYFQGLERMKLMGSIDIGGRILATLGIFLLVHRSSDGWKVMASQALGCIVSHAVTVFFAFREVGFRFPTPVLIWNAWRLGWHMFMFRASQTLSGTANGLIMGALAPASALGIFTGAERIAWVARQALWPITQALYPRLSSQMQSSPDTAARTVQYSLVVIGSLATAFAAILVVLAPLIVRVVLGPQYVAAIPTLRIFGLMLPLVAFFGVLSFQWTLPLGLDREFNFIVLTSGIINIVLGILLVPKLSHVGMALALLTQQIYSLAALCWILRVPQLNPLLREKRKLDAVPANGLLEPD
jgi:polysaccharide transporter, PST family